MNVSTINFEVGIPVDSDGYIEMECDFCKNRFMLPSKFFQDDEHLHFFCPICGLPNKINTFYCPEALEKIEQTAMNYMYREIEKTLGRTIKGINKSGFIKMSMDIPKQEPEKELYTPANEYEEVRLNCCNASVKVQYIDKEIGVYCPLCGDTKL